VELAYRGEEMKTREAAREKDRRAFVDELVRASYEPDFDGWLRRKGAELTEKTRMANRMEWHESGSFGAAIFRAGKWAAENTRMEVVKSQPAVLVTVSEVGWAEWD
jgi:hypothetical protein